MKFQKYIIISAIAPHLIGVIHAQEPQKDRRTMTSLTVAADTQTSTTSQHHAKLSEANAAAKALIARVTPEYAHFFEVDTTLPKVDGQDTYSVSDAPNGKILLRGNNGVSVASAYHWYLKNRCGSHLSWCGDQLDLPKNLPKVGEKVIVSTLQKHRVYFNYCTLNYTASWWNWDRWQRETDFMAMNGINMPLGVIGLEGVWYHTLLKHGFSDVEARSFLVAPTHFAWQWMTNIQGDSDPLPKEWIDQRIELGRKLLERQRSLGMTPIQQGFTGFVPRELKEKYPNATIAKESRWCGYQGTAQLDPLDPLFKKLGKTFLETQIELYGTSHIYAADPFHEGHPPRPGKEYLSKVGNEIYQLISEVDPEATIAMQAWSIRKEICEAFPKEHLIVLDLSGKRSSFWGYPYVKGQLHNFGGRINMHGDLQYVAENPFAKAAQKDPLCVGMGVFAESIEQNPVFYNMVFDMVWRDEPVDTQQWLNNYAERRYGKKSKNAQAAWKLLLEGPYKRGTNGVESSSIVAARPALVAKKSGPNAGFHIPYKPQNLVKAWELLLKDYELLKDSKGYQFDVADVGRQVLSNLGQEFHRDVEYAFFKKDQQALEAACTRFLTLLDNIDEQLAPVPTHHFGKWLGDARSFSEDPETQAYYEKYASLLISTWGPIDKPLIFDYSWREWSGLIKQYYHPRWEMFFDHLQDQLAANKDYVDPKSRSHGRESLRANGFYSKLADWEIAWAKKSHPIPEVSSVNAADIGLKLFAKYQPIIEITYTTQRLDRIKEMKQAKADAAHKAGKKIASWSPKTIKDKWTPQTIDITKALNDAGTYEVTFIYKSGAKQLDIASVELMLNGAVLYSDKHEGFTGGKSSKNIYTLKLKDFAFNSDYQLRFKVRGNGGNNSTGSIFIKKK